uniref:Uncharacterized protein n=1 Tax=Arundo donax TaxID=35708 RepID=A0A0A8Y2H7_ARUDO
MEAAAPWRRIAGRRSSATLGRRSETVITSLARASTTCLAISRGV